jgi:hypothetical protein
MNRRHIAVQSGLSRKILAVVAIATVTLGTTISSGDSGSTAVTGATCTTVSNCQLGGSGNCMASVINIGTPTTPSWVCAMYQCSGGNIGYSSCLLAQGGKCQQGKGWVTCTGCNYCVISGPFSTFPTTCNFNGVQCFKCPVGSLAGTIPTLNYTGVCLY